MEAAHDATRRTRLANDRTQLAWWRTGMTALAVGLAVGRVVPLLGETAHRWPYTVIGVGFALYGFALIAYGRLRTWHVTVALARGADLPPEGPIISVLTGAGLGLALATAVLIVVE